jgi:ribosome maturation factor RimP
MAHPLVEKIRGVVTGPIEGSGYELVDVEWKREPGGWVLRVYVDHAPGVAPSVGPVGIEDCERVSRQLSAVLDVADVIPQAYNLEVSSPGLERPLRTAEHFRRFLGKRCRVRLVAGIDGRRNFAGTIKDVSPEGTAVTVNADGQDFVLPLADLDKANLVYEFDAPAPQKQKHKKGRKEGTEKAGA